VVETEHDLESMHMGRNATDLLAILRSEVLMACWQRRLAKPLTDWLDALPDERLPQLRAQGCTDELSDAIDTALASLRMANPEATELFRQDLLRLLAVFVSLSQNTRLRLRIERIDNDACRKWHQDWTALRLLCTYRGSGTQWVVPQDSKEALRTPDQDHPRQRQLQRGDVALLKGRGQDPHSPLPSVVHRSPRHFQTQASRLLLVMEPA
jgi:hypothetical protein